MAENPFQELHDLLKELEEFLTTTLTPDVKNLIRSVGALVPQVPELIDLIVDLLGQVDSEIRAIDLTAPGLTEASEFADKVVDVLKATRPFVSSAAGASVDNIVAKAEALSSFSAVGEELRNAILALIATIVTELNSLKPSS